MNLLTNISHELFLYFLFIHLTLSIYYYIFTTEIMIDSTKKRGNEMKKQLVDDSTKQRIIEDVENTFHNARFMNKKVTAKDIDDIVDIFVDFRLKRKDEKEIREIASNYMNEKEYSIN